MILKISLCIRKLEREKKTNNQTTKKTNNKKTPNQTNPKNPHMYTCISGLTHYFTSCSALYLSVTVLRTSCAAGAHSATSCTKHLSRAWPCALCGRIVQVAEEDC